MVNTFHAVAAKWGATAEVTVAQVYPNIKLDVNDRVVEIAIRAADNLGVNHHIKHTGGGSDANIYNGKGIPTANLGIGMSKVHSTDEFIKVEDLVQSAKYLLEIIKLIN